MRFTRIINEKGIPVSCRTQLRNKLDKYSLCAECGRPDTPDGCDAQRDFQDTCSLWMAKIAVWECPAFFPKETAP